MKDEVLVEFDHHDGEVNKDPFPVYEALRSKCPVTWTDAHGGFWVLSDYFTVSRAARDEHAFRSGDGISIPNHSPVRSLPIETDSPRTQKLRRLLQDQFSPSAASAAEPALRDLSDQLMDKFIEHGQCDLMSDFGTLVPAIHITRALGFDDSLVLDLVTWVHVMANTFGTDPDQAFNAALSIYSEIQKQIEHLKVAGLEGDVISALMAGEIDGTPLSQDDIASYVFTLIGGGLDTTGSALGNALIRIHREPELRQKLLERPELVPAAVEEFLRLDAPVQALARTMAVDVDFCGQQLQIGDKVLLLWGSANRDPQVFDHPDEVCVEREQNRHLSFGVGPHRCIGSHIGRTMFRVMLETVLSRIPDFELLGDPQEHSFPSSVVFGVEHLPARFSPGQKVATEHASVASRGAAGTD